MTADTGLSRRREVNGVSSWANIVGPVILHWGHVKRPLSYSLRQGPWAGAGRGATPGGAAHSQAPFLSQLKHCLS